MCRRIAGDRRRADRVPEPVRDHPIMTRRSRGREVALQVLYQVEQNAGVPLAEVRRFIQRRLLGDRKLCEFTEGLIAGVKEHQARIDALISEVAENWRLDRMAAIDRNILRLGAYEMLFCPEVPAQVAINEALELAKRYSTAQSSRFVNGILDRVLQSQIAAGPAGPRAGLRRARAERPPRPSRATAAPTPEPDPPPTRGRRRMRRQPSNRPGDRDVGTARRGAAAAPTCTCTRRTPTGPARPARWWSPRRGSGSRRWRSPTTTRSRPWPWPGPRRGTGASS